MKVQTNLEKLLFTTVKIETVFPDGSSGSGTGFFFCEDLGHTEVPFIVTNKHVISDGIGGRLVFTQSKDGAPSIGDGYTLNLDQSVWDHWFGHPDPDVDIAIIGLSPLLRQIKQDMGVDFFIQYIDPSIVPTQAQLDSLNVLETVTFVGYPNGIWDSKNLTPIMRRGTTATPLSLDFDGEPKFLIDASVFGGSSGSPVFIADNGTFTDRNGNAHVGSRVYFLGVIAAVYYKTDQNSVKAIPIPTQFQDVVETKQMIDLGIVFKARTVTETVDAFIAKHDIK